MLPLLSILPSITTSTNQFPHSPRYKDFGRSKFETQWDHLGEEMIARDLQFREQKKEETVKFMANQRREEQSKKEDIARRRKDVPTWIYNKGTRKFRETGMKREDLGADNLGER
jgi:hypothetical protein